MVLCNILCYSKVDNMKRLWKRVEWYIIWYLFPSVVEERNGVLRVSKIIDGQYCYKEYKLKGK